MQFMYRDFRYLIESQHYQINITMAHIKFFIENAVEQNIWKKKINRNH